MWLWKKLLQKFFFTTTSIGCSLLQFPSQTYLVLKYWEMSIQNIKKLVEILWQRPCKNSIWKMFEIFCKFHLSIENHGKSFGKILRLHFAPDLLSSAHLFCSEPRYEGSFNRSSISYNPTYREISKTYLQFIEVTRRGFDETAQLFHCYTWDDEQSLLSDFDKILSSLTLPSSFHNPDLTEFNEPFPEIALKFTFSFISVLSNCFPEMEISPPKRHSVPNGYWKNVTNQKMFFDDVAKKLSIHFNSSTPRSLNLTLNLQILK